MTRGAQAGAWLGDLTWEEAAQRLPSTLVIIPFAAGAKEHGPHLPMNTDAVVMHYLVEAAVSERDVVVAPPILHGWFPAFRGYPGTEVADGSVFAAYVRAVADSLVAHGARRIVFLNTGISKATGLPLMMVFSKLSFWLREIGVDRSVIGGFYAVSLAYSLKVFWAPVVDRVRIPGLTGALGQRPRARSRPRAGKRRRASAWPTSACRALR